VTSIGLTGRLGRIASRGLDHRHIHDAFNHTDDDTIVLLADVELGSDCPDPHVRSAHDEWAGAVGGD
jgi:hypothetical protein